MKLIKKLTHYTTPLSLGVVFSTCMIGCGPYRSGQRLLPTPQQLGGGLAHTVNVNPGQVTDEMLNSIFNFTKTATLIRDKACGEFLYNVLTDLKNGDSEAIHRVYDNGIISDAIRGNLTTLHIAVLIGNINIIKLLLEHGVNRDAKDKKAGFTALMLTIGNQNDHDSNIAQLLLQHGANPNATNNNGKTALRLAAHHKHLGVFKVLIDHGVDVVANITPNNKKRMVRMVVRLSNLQLITKLIRLGQTQNDTEMLGELHFCLGRAAIHGAQDFAQNFLCGGEFLDNLPYDSVIASTPTTTGNQLQLSTHGNSPLTQNVLQGGLNANPSELTANPTDLLIPAIINGNIQKVQELLDQGANPNVPDKDGNLPLAIAIETRNSDLNIVSLLLSHDADPSSSYAILNAVRTQWTGLVYLLISNISNRRDIPDTQYEQAFNMAIEAGNPEITYLLLKKVVELAIMRGTYNNAGYDQQDVITMINHKLLAPYIVTAVYQGEVDKVRSLLQLGANPNTVDQLGHTLLMIAEQYGKGPSKQTLIDILLSAGAIRK